MTFVHIGDAHLRSSSPRHVDRLSALDQVIQVGLQQRDLAAWLWPGDLFDTRSTVDDRNDLAARLVQMANHAPAVICYGNHEAAGDLDVFGRLRAAHPIHVISTPRVVRVNSQAAVFVLPYPTRGGLVAAGADHQRVYDEAQLALDAIVADAVVELDRCRDEGLVTCAIGHVNVAGSVASTGQPQIGREIELSPTTLARLGRRYVGLNHIHRAQTVHGATYAGSICRMDFGEIEPKRALLVDIDLESYALTDIPIAVPPLYHVEGDLTRDGFVGQVIAGPGGGPQEAPASWAGCEVRVRFRFKASERDLVHVETVRAGFRDALRVHLDPVAVPDRGLRAPQVAAARTLAEKVQAWAEVAGGAVPAGVLERLADLDTREEDALLAALDADLQALTSGGSREAVAA